VLSPVIAGAGIGILTIPDWDPTGGAGWTGTTNLVRVNASNVGFGIHITGMIAAPDGTIATLLNIADQAFLAAIQTEYDDASSIAANRFWNRGKTTAMGSNLSSTTYRYDASLAGGTGRWQELWGTP